MAVSWHLFLWPIVCVSHCTFCERQESYHIFSYNHQFVSGITDFVRGSFITSFPVINRMWVTFIFCGRQFHHIFSYDQQEVSGIFAYFVEGNVITSFLWPTASKWHHKFSDLDSQETSTHEHLMFHYILHTYTRKWIFGHIFLMIFILHH